MTDEQHILLAEDDVNFGSVLKSFLEMHWYRVMLCDNGEKAYTAFRNHSFDICLVDVMMPFKDGLSLVKDIRRADDDVPIVFITAKSLKQDMLLGFETGADDYITKPFDTEILLHKIKALLRRNGKHTAENTVTGEDTAIGGFIFNNAQRTLQGPDGAISLSPKEAELLNMFCSDENRMVERSKALVKLWGEDNYFTARSMDVYITRLRRYFKADPAISIVNIQRKGFRLVVVAENSKF